MGRDAALAVRRRDFLVAGEADGGLPTGIMKLSEILSADRILVDTDGGFVQEKIDSLRILARMLGDAVGVGPREVEKALLDREKLQSTGIGDGVGIPHTYLDQARGQVAGLVLCPQGVPFQAIDEAPVTIIFGVIGPRRETGEHLKVLARISRMLRDGALRAELAACESPEAVMALVLRHEGGG